MDIAGTIRGIVDEMGISPYEVNCGRCDEFAMRLEELLGPDSIEHVTEEFDGEYSSLPGHYWVEYGGRHYDAETPHGVENWMDLPIFHNAAIDIS